MQDEHAVTDALRQLWATFKFRSRKVALGVTHQQIVVRETTVANLPAREMRQALPFRATRCRCRPSGRSSTATPSRSRATPTPCAGC